MSGRAVVWVVVLAVASVAGVAGASAGRPVVAVVAYDRGTETTDFLVPYGVLAMSDAVELHAVSTGSATVTLHPALAIELDETLDAFDAAHPGGADVVIVPAVHDPSDARLVG